MGRRSAGVSTACICAARGRNLSWLRLHGPRMRIALSGLGPMTAGRRGVPRLASGEKRRELVGSVAHN
eukprot:8869888-Alexandrium_andersonii.AAC.1